MVTVRKNHTLFSFMQTNIAQLIRLGRRTTAKNYAATLRSFMRFRGELDVQLDMISSILMEEYEAYLRFQRKVKRNSSSFYMRNLRTVYNRAVEENLTVNQYPFRHVYTGIDKTRKRALPFTAIQAIKNLDLSLRPAIDYTRDMFMLSFYLRGMSFVDMAFLRKTDLRDGVLYYRRSKTQQPFRIQWEPQMQDIVDKYRQLAASTPHLLPIIIGTDEDEWRQYERMENRLNCNLKEVGRLAGFTEPLTMYVARHSWASIARDRNVRMSVISEALGHDSEHTTRIYLSTIETYEVDKVNHRMINDL